MTPQQPQPIPLKDGSQYEVPADFLRELRENYFDVDQELRSMRMWALANPAKRKTRRGIQRFIVGWLEGWGRKPSKRRPDHPAVMSLQFNPRPITVEQRTLNTERLAQLKAALKRE